jgi:hypothetical protein
MALAYIEAADPADLPMAKEINETLHAVYPNHSWWVRIDGGLVIIKHFSISGTCGMVRKYADLAHDALARKRNVIMAAGELLERAGMKRGAYEAQPVTHLERDKDVKWQPQVLVQPEVH